MFTIINFISILIVIYFVFFITPNSFIKIFIFNVCLSLLTFQLIKKFVRKELALVISFFFFLVIISRSLKIIDYFNFIILFLFLLSVLFLIK
jgi:hypothetical protein